MISSHFHPQLSQTNSSDGTGVICSASSRYISHACAVLVCSGPRMWRRRYQFQRARCDKKDKHAQLSSCSVRTASTRPASMRAPPQTPYPCRPGGSQLPAQPIQEQVTRTCQAAENGATGVELDLEFSADGVPILMHDDTVERTTDGAGRLRDLTFEEIRKLNPSAKHRLRSQFQDEKIPTLREAVVESMHHNLTIYFDVKGHANQAVDALKQLYQEFPQLYNSSIVCSFMPDVVYKMRQADRNVVTALTHRPWQLSHLGDGTPRFNSFWKHFLYMVMDVILDWSLHSFLWRLCGVSAFLIQKNFVSQDYVRHWSSRGIQVVAWTVNTFAEKSYYESVLDCSYITDSLVEDCDPHY
ncbi:glycerophosphodiester phosphodiesterase 1 isoform X1 [Sylvia atricapilla]